MNKYHFVAKEVEPKRMALKAAQEELDVLTQSLNKLRTKLKEVEDRAKKAGSSPGASGGGVTEEQLEAIIAE